MVEVAIINKTDCFDLGMGGALEVQHGAQGVGNMEHEAKRPFNLDGRGTRHGVYGSGHLLVEIPICFFFCGKHHWEDAVSYCSKQTVYSYANVTDGESCEETDTYSS